MSELQQFSVQTTNGRSGKVFRASRFLDKSEFNRVLLDDGSDLNVPARILRVQEDGSFLLNEALLGEAKAASPPALPPREPAPHGTAAIVVDEPLFVDDVQVERIPINRIIEGPLETRQEGNVTIVPVVEEVVMIEKRLLLKEEVRITRQRTEVARPRRVVLGEGDSRLIGSDGRVIEIREGR